MPNPIPAEKPVYIIDSRIFQALPAEQARELHLFLYGGSRANLGDRLVQARMPYPLAGEIERQIHAGKGNAKALTALAVSGASAELLEGIINTFGATARRDAAAREGAK
jgi:hypothetical protein